MAPTATAIIPGARGRRMVKWAVMATMFVSAFDWGGRDFLPFAMVSLISCGLLFCWAVKDLRAGGRLFPGTGLNFPFGLLSLVCLSSLTYSIDRFSTGYNLVKLLAYGAMFFAAVRSFREKEVEGLFVAVFGWTILLSGFGIWQYLAGKGQFPLANAWRAQGVFSTPNIFASFLLMPLFPMMACFLMADRQSWRTGLGIAVGVSYVALLATFSRAGIASFVVSAGVFVPLLIRYAPAESRRRIVHLAAIVVASTILFLAHNAAFMKGSFAGRAAELAGENHGDVYGRWNIWKGCYSAWKHYPLMGAGLGTFCFLWPQYKPAAMKGVPAYFVHNDYLQVLCELGVAGLVALAWLLLAAVGESWKCIRTARGTKSACLSAGILCGLSGRLVHSSVDFSFLVPGVMCLAFLMMGCQAVISRETLRRSEIWAVKGEVGKARLSLRRGVCAAAMVASATVTGLVLSIGFGESQMIKAERLLEEGKRVEAMWHMEHAIRVCPYVPRYHLNLGRAYLAASRFSVRKEFDRRAEEEYQTVIRLSPHDVWGWIGLGDVLVHRGTREGLHGAVRCLERARELSPFAPLPRYKLGLAYLALGKVADAREEFILCKGNQPENSLIVRRIERLLAAEDAGPERTARGKEPAGEGSPFSRSCRKAAVLSRDMGKVN